MAERDKRHEWSFEAQWTWSSGGRREQASKTPSCGEQFSTKDKEAKCQFSTKQKTSDELDISPTITRVYHDGGSEIEMECLWQQPSTCSIPIISVNQQQRGELNVAGHRTAMEPIDNRKGAQPTVIQRPARSFGSNGRHHHSTNRGDSGYGSNDQSSSLLAHNIISDSESTAKYNKAMAIIPPTNGRCKSSCNITLEGNSPTVWSADHAQPIFHGPNCECIVCHDMQVRFESTPAVGKPSSQLMARSCSPKALDKSSVSASLPTPMYRSHFCTHVRGKRSVPLVPSSETQSDTSEIPFTLKSVTEPLQGIIDKLSELPVTSYSIESKANVSRHVKRKELNFDAQTATSLQHLKRGESESSQVGRRLNRYSYPSTNVSRLKPRVIRIDVYCADEEEDTSEDEQVLSVAEPECKDEIPVNVYSSRHVPTITTESHALGSEIVGKPPGFYSNSSPRSEAFLRAERLFGGSTGRLNKLSVPHVGPAKNKNCNCDTCLRFFKELTNNPAPVFAKQKPNVTSVNQRVGQTDENKSQPTDCQFCKP